MNWAWVELSLWVDFVCLVWIWELTMGDDLFWIPGFDVDTQFGYGCSSWLWIPYLVMNACLVRDTWSGLKNGAQSQTPNNISDEVTVLTVDARLFVMFKFITVLQNLHHNQHPGVINLALIPTGPSSYARYFKDFMKSYRFFK
jgi:hypothetical protein